MTEKAKYDKITQLGLPEILPRAADCGRTIKGKEHEAEDRTVPGTEKSAKDFG